MPNPLDILDPKKDIAAATPEIDKSVASIITALEHLFDGYTITIKVEKK